MSKLKVAVYGGSFNPPTSGHMKIVNQLIREKTVDVILVVPCGSRTDKPKFISSSHRLRMLKISLDEMLGFDILVIDSKKSFNLHEIKNSIAIDAYELLNSDSMVPTADLFVHYRKVYPDAEFHFTMGSDLLSSLHKWEDYETTLKHLDYIIFNRENYPIDEHLVPRKAEIIYIAPSWYVSSTSVRNLIDEHSANKEEMAKQLAKIVSKGTVIYILSENLYL